MIRYRATVLLLGLAAGAANAAVPLLPKPGGNYYSMQIASSPSLRDLERQYSQYAGLPFLRIERRGDLYVIRAGFWSSAREGRDSSLQWGGHDASKFLRISTFRPEAIMRRNWNDDAPVATTASAMAPPMSPPTSSEPLPVPQRSMALAALPEKPGGAQGSAPVTREAAAAHSDNDDGLLPFDAKDYALAFDALLASGDQEHALRLARKAVASVPDDLGWRRKLARVAEWTHHPELASEQWEVLFRRGDHSDETLAALLRLDLLSANSDVALEVWGIRAERGSLNDAQWEDIHALYEQASKAQQGSQFFERHFRRTGKIRLLDYAAQLAENIGDDERALRLYDERLRFKPFSLDAALHAAIFLVRRDRLREAYTLLEAHRDEVPADALQYWEILGNISWELAEPSMAEYAVRRQGESRQAQAADWSRLIFLVRQQHPQQAADLAYTTYRRFGNSEYLIYALNLYGEMRDLAAQGRIFKSLDLEILARMEIDPRFLVARAQYRQLMQGKDNKDQAWADYRRALAINPDDNDVLVAAFWFLIDDHRKEVLLPLLQRLAPRAENTPAFWLPFAAAHHAFDRYQDALYWYRKEVARNPDDMLLLLNYADVLERTQQAGMAERVRRHAWLRLREKFPAADVAASLDRNPELLALARLAILNQPGDPGLALVRKVVERLRGVAGETKSNENIQQTNELILGWAISQEQYLNARAWMWLNYVRKAGEPGSPPLWGESQTALQLNDSEAMDALLIRQGDGLPIYNRYDTAYALDHWPLALDIAFRGQENSGVDEELYDRYRQHAPLHANYIQARATSDTFGNLASHERQFELKLVADRRLHLRFGWSQLSQTSSDSGLATPERQRLSNVEARWLEQRGETSFALFRRDELAGNSGWRLGQSWAWSTRLNLDGSLARRADATDSLPLRVGGYEDQLRLGLNYAVGKREYVAITPRLARYYTQYDDYLGSGRILDLEAGYRIRTEYPDWRLRAFATKQSVIYDGAGQISASALARLAPDVQNAIAAGSIDAAHYFIPNGSTTWGVCFGMGENLAGQSLQDIYTRAWRHFYDVCPTHNTLNGAGYTSVIGLAGSLTGEDHLSLRLDQASGGNGSGALTRTLAARYRHYF